MKTVFTLCLFTAAAAALAYAVGTTRPAEAQTTFAVPVSPPAAFIKAGKYLINPGTIAWVARDADEQLVSTGSVTVAFVGDPTSKIVLTRQDAAEAWTAFSRYPVQLR
jgi:hypothetical protein